MQIKRGNKTVLVLEIAFFLIAVIYITLLSRADDLVRNLFLISILLFFCIFSIRHLGFKKDNNYLKMPTTWLIIANSFLFVLIMGVIGVFTDFTTEYFQPTWAHLWQKILPIAVISAEIELFRYIIASKVEKNSPLLIAFSLICSAIFLSHIPRQIANVGSSVVIFTTFTLAIRVISTCTICTYLVSHFGFLPALFYHFIIALSMYVLPVWPRMGALISLIIAIAYPLFTLIVVRHHEIFSERNHAKARAFNLSFFSFPIILILAALGVLNSGITGYETLAIASNSMQPAYGRGDIVIYKRKEPSDIHVDDILVFKRGNRIITHRVVEVRGSGESRRFIVRGDNNIDIDDYSVSAEDVRGTVCVVGHYIGYPSLILNGISETEE